MHWTQEAEPGQPFWQIVAMPFAVARGAWPYPSRVMFRWWRVGWIEVRRYVGLPHWGQR